MILEGIIEAFFSYSGPKHVYECNYCGRKFKKKNKNSTLRPHKDKSGYHCIGKRGYYIGYE